MPGWSRTFAIAMMLWWGFFGSVSLSWALGSPWLVDTVVQGDGLRLAQERPTWFVVVVFVSGLVKLGFVVFGCALLYPDTIRAPLGATGLRLGLGGPAHGLWAGRFRAGNHEAPGGRITLALRLVAVMPVDAAFLGRWHPGASRNNCLPALE